MRIFAAAILLVGASTLVSASAVETDLDLAKSRYEEAAYEDALAILASVEPSTAGERVQVEQYRALCHIALGDAVQAEQAVIALVDADPTYLPPSTIASPKVLAMVAETRRRHIPVVARKLLDDGRAAFAEKRMARAAEQFALLLKLLDEPGMVDLPERADFRMLAQGFATLATASAAPAPVANAGTSSTAPAPVANAGTSSTARAPVANAGTSSTARAPVANANAGTSVAPPPASGAAAASRPAAPPAFTPAVPLQETLPAWTPPNRAIGRSEYTGSLKLHIGADGRVKNATMEKPSHPAYDAALLGAAKTWRYKPATHDGESTESERVIAIRLRPVS